MGASSRKQLDDDFVLIALQGDIDRPAGDPEPAQDHFLQEVGQDGALERDLARRGIQTDKIVGRISDRKIGAAAAQACGAQATG